MSKKSGWIRVGRIGVDAGLVWVGDPCYIIHSDNKNEELGDSWDEFCEILDSKEKLESENGSCGGGRDGVFDFGILGCCVHSGFGDGEYDVYVKYSDEGNFGKRVAEIKVVFI